MLEQMGIAAKAASYKLALLSSGEKNRVLEKIADELEAQMESILSANVQDVEQARANGLSEVDAGPPGADPCASESDCCTMCARSVISPTRSGR